jgi:four helix bundle protein
MERAHKQLRVWKESMHRVKMVYEITALLPVDERFGLISQMRRAAVSIPSNIAEGSARQTKKEAIQFYTIARGSLSELDTQIELCINLGLLSETQITKISDQVETVGALLNGLIRFKKTGTKQSSSVSLLTSTK